jgi:hypothetical protein
VRAVTALFLLAITALTIAAAIQGGTIGGI